MYTAVGKDLKIKPDLTYMLLLGEKDGLLLGKKQRVSFYFLKLRDKYYECSFLYFLNIEYFKRKKLIFNVTKLSY